MLALLGERRSPATVREEPGIAAAPAASGGGEPAIAVIDQVGEHLARVQVTSHGAFGDMDDQVGPRLAMHVFALAVHAVTGATVRMIAKREQRRDVAVGDEPDVATLSAIAAVGATHDDRPLATERDAACAAVAAPHIQLRFINKSGHSVVRGYLPLGTPPL